MKRQIALIIASAALVFAAPAARTFTGTITDNMCARSGHSSMNMGNDAKCVEECVKGMHGKYVLYDGKEAYALNDQNAPAKFASKKVRVTGTLDAGSKIIHVEKIEAVK
jgi:hypothetical protein